MVIHCVGIPAAPDVGVDHVLSGVEVQRHDSLVVIDHDSFSHLHCRHSVFTIRHLSSCLDVSIISKVAILSTVHSTASYEHVEECVRILIVSNPTGSGNHEVSSISVGEVCCPFLVDKLYVDSEVCLPLLLNELSNSLVA